MSSPGKRRMAKEGRFHIKPRAVRLAIAAFKLVSGTAELLTGLSLIVIPKAFLAVLLRTSSSLELAEDPSDRLALLVQHRLPQLLGGKLQIALGLIALGLLKLIGAIAILRRKAWGYYLLLGLMTFLAPFDVLHAVKRHTAISVALAVLNLLVLGALIVFRKTMIAKEVS